MTRSDSLPDDDFLNSTSARTRPLSFDDIMLRRKNKVDTAKKLPSALGVADIESAQDNTVTEFDFPECHHQTKNAAEPMDEMNTSKYSQKVRFERKEDSNSSRKIEKLVKVNAEGSLDADAKSKSKGARNVTSSSVSEGKNEREYHGNRKKGGLLRSIVSDNRPDKRKYGDSYKKDGVSERSRVKSEIVKNQHHSDEREVNRKRKMDGQMSSDSDNEYKNRNPKDVRQTDKLTGRGKEKPEKENSRHKRSREEDKARGRITVKKKELEKRGLEPARAYVEQSRPKRRGSHSREREIDRGRRSPSQSAARAYVEQSRPKRRGSHSREREIDRGRRSPSQSQMEHISKDRRELAEPSYPTKDRSGREHSDVDKKRMPSNGSGIHYRRNTNSSSGLGGYSPRKRKTDAAAKTPSPTHRSPEKRTAGWDLQPVEKESIMVMAGSTVSSLNATGQSLSLDIQDFPSVTSVASTVLKPLGISLHTLSSQMHAVESIQLTQATRPMRRLYVENLPASASEEDLKESINKLLMSAAVNYIQGTQPCISCIIHKEKSQALLEFLTPEDASAALSLDGMSFSGSNVKLRRPKDYANVTTGLSDKSLGAVDSISDLVEDSPNKIFIGGISKLYSSRMLLEIAQAFGSVKAFHFEFIADINEPCAFLEYVDQSVTSKACAGLNGMRLGGQVLTAVLANPESVLEEGVGKLPIYGIPKHVEPLLEKPTTVLKLKNVLYPGCLESLSEVELEEILQDIKLECSRFGTVKSVNVAKSTSTFSSREACEVKNTSGSADAHNLDRSHTIEQLGESSFGVEKAEKKEPLNEGEIRCPTLEYENGCDNSRHMSDPLIVPIEPEDKSRSGLVGDRLHDETCEPPMNGEDVSPVPVGFTREYKSAIELESSNYDREGKPWTDKFKSYEEELKLERNNGNTKTDGRKDVFVDGSVFVEYRREEAACIAAHCLHGRTFDGRVVTVEYFGHHF